ncbi:MAG: ABC transporter ATP-binding protein [Bullifex sp.]|nr:ABC transporter ATP-binding protein [Spirochaetales bacterium]MDY2816308.1 ABC transporter ATP-binding protein [Bullifex sp.]MDD7007569.1 ABC transporter ATP-binding protein [Spirochaetales bacterium]MDD7535509.1 ABC transporter ATP-binding protein [Spirochaetales bacterium]MDY4799718.1 ABC transporter ATP-binding protein [Bullifex sp.]
MSEYAIEMLGITKTFPGIIANDNVDLRIRTNEVHAILGENGAGKSTLMSVLFGAYAPDSGEIRIKGKKVEIKNPNIATELGIGMVHQHFKLVHNYTVTENIVLGREPRNRFGIVSLAQAEKKVSELSRRYGLSVDPRAKIDDITVGQQQRVEILKTLYSDSDIIILDEPTAVLTPQEIDELMDIIRTLKKEGKTIVLITHKLKEIKAVADRCSVLRRGRFIGCVDITPETEEQELATMMVGRSVRFDIDKAPCTPGEAVLEIKNLSVKDSVGTMKVKDLSLTVRRGEIMGVAGVDGNGQSELLYALSGLSPVAGGEIILSGRVINKDTIMERIEEGMGHIPEDRRKHGLVAGLTVAENLALKDFNSDKYSGPFGMLNFRAMEENAEKLISEFDIRTAQGAVTEAGSLSGGNQQKVIVAREISLSPDVLLIAQPTRGLDVGAIEYIRKRIVEERDKGRAILLVSFELDEIMNLCDRIATISKGSIVGVFDRDEVTSEEIGLMMTGIRAKEAK